MASPRNAAPAPCEAPRCFARRRVKASRGFSPAADGPRSPILEPGNVHAGGHEQPPSSSCSSRDRADSSVRRFTSNSSSLARSARSSVSRSLEAHVTHDQTAQQQNQEHAGYKRGADNGKVGSLFDAA